MCVAALCSISFSRKDEAVSLGGDNIMNEAEWMACSDPKPMLEYLRGSDAARKLLLFALACCQRTGRTLPAEVAPMLAVAERAAEGSASQEEVDGAHRATLAYCRAAAQKGSRGEAGPASFLPEVHGIDRVLRAGTSFWDPAWYNAQLLASDGAQGPAFAEGPEKARLLREIFGPQLFRSVAIEDSWLAWNAHTVSRLAPTVYDERAFHRFPVVADALEEAGCSDNDLLDHFRDPGPHYRGCWALDLVLGRTVSRRRLRFVDLSGQRLQQLPANLFATDDIWRLDLIQSGIEEIPEEIGRLTRLRTLYANYCRLTSVPKSLGRLTGLEDLWLNDNLLTGLPDEVRHLALLKNLALDKNRFGCLPACVRSLRRLENLRVTDNAITELPEWIGELGWLSNLSLGRNRLHTVPRSIGRLHNLSYLGLQGNPIRSLPAEVWRLPSLITLNLSCTGFTDLPPEAARVPNLLM